jgi:hypothetical protein
MGLRYEWALFVENVTWSLMQNQFKIKNPTPQNTVN